MDYGRFWFFGRQVKHLLLSLGVPALILLDGLPAAGQINTGKVTGIVTDSAGAVVPGAKVSAVNEQTGVSTTARTLDTGSYLINFLIPGQYTVEIEAQGFGRTLERGVEAMAERLALIFHCT